MSATVLNKEQRKGDHAERVSGTFLAESSQDPLEYVDGMSLYRGYFVPGAMDPSGGYVVQDKIDTIRKPCIIGCGGDGQGNYFQQMWQSEINVSNVVSTLVAKQDVRRSALRSRILGIAVVGTILEQTFQIFEWPKGY